MTRRLLLIVTVALTLTGCGVQAPAGAATSQPAVQSTPAPVGVVVPAIDADSSVEPYGLNPDGSMAVAPVDQPWRAGWYSLGVAPGDPGPAVITGHVSGQVNGQSVPGVFARLRELAPGDDVWIDRADGSRLRFSVARVEQHDKDAFPTAAVYGDAPGAELRLVTCGGDLDGTDGARSYRDNVIAFATLTAVIPA